MLQKMHLGVIYLTINFFYLQFQKLKIYFETLVSCYEDCLKSPCKVNEMA